MNKRLPKISKQKEQGGVAGLNLAVFFGALGEKKWNTKNFKVKEMVSKFTEADRQVVKELNYIADGELSGSAMMFCLYEACKNNPNGFSEFYEPLFYSANTIVYDEFRHGLIIKEILAEIDGEPSFIASVSGEKVAATYLKINTIWKNPFEVLVSFLTGEITNIILYREASKKVKNKELKSILLNISKDEYRHKTAWRDMCKKIVASAENGTERFLEAFAANHYKHQAEIGGNYVGGMVATKHYFTKKIAMEIFKDKVEILESIVGKKNTISIMDLVESQQKHLERQLGTPKK